jgi:DNA-binding HxlR family transcriptional regulator
MSQRNIEVTDQLSEACAILEVLDHVAGKWNLGVLVAAADGPIRFTELERTVPGISRRMLTLTLRKMERDGLVIRTVYPTVPPKVEYTLTEMARDLHRSLGEFLSWGERHQPAVAAARLAFDRDVRPSP